MSDIMSQYKDLFVETGRQYLTTLNQQLLIIEKDPANKEAIAEIFRAAHSLKGQSAAMGYERTGYLCHVVEDAFFEIQEGRRDIDPPLADLLFKALDSLNESVDKIEADGSELDVSSVAEELKQLTGVSTTGAGKSARGAEEKASSEASEPTAEPNLEASAAQETQETKQPEQEPPEVATEAPDKPKSKKTLAIKTIPVKVESLEDIVGVLEELMIHRLTMQGLLTRANDPELNRVQDKIDELLDLVQFQIMKIRTVPVNMVFEHFPRMVRDLGRMLNKSIDLEIRGGELELDRTIVERLDEPLTHLIRNAADHGVGEKGGKIKIEAFADRDYAIVEVSDNGQGINWAAVSKKSGIDVNNEAALKKSLFAGVSTTEKVSLISGRGVGLDVVKKTIEDFGGTVDLESVAGKGTTFILRLPLSVSVAKTLTVEVQGRQYSILTSAVGLSIRLQDLEIVHTAGQAGFRYMDQEIPLVDLVDLLGLSKNDDYKSTYAVIIDLESDKVALGVDKVNETLEAVIKPLPGVLRNTALFSGVTIIKDGRSVLLLNPRSFLNE
jgi:two-component system chemotaxis sensor kinase CheA